MKLSILIFFSFLFACSPPNSYSPAEDAQDAGRQFIRASLDGDYQKAEFFLLKDTLNLLLLQMQESNYQQMVSDMKREYREANIRPLGIRNENDSTVLYKYYHSSNPKDTTTIRIVRINDEWLVDLKSILKK